MILIGNGTTAGFHHPAHDFNDEAVPQGNRYWHEVIAEEQGTAA